MPSIAKVISFVAIGYPRDFNVSDIPTIVSEFPKFTRADSDARLTATPDTSGSAVRAFSTRPTQDAQVMPSIWNAI
jgi:hypothetical protein